MHQCRFFYKVTLVKVCILVQKVVTLASGKGCCRVKDDLHIFFGKICFLIIAITQALRSLTAGIAIKCLALLKGVNSLIMLRVLLRTGEKRWKGHHLLKCLLYLFVCSCHIVDFIRPRVPTVPSAITASTLPRCHTKVKLRPTGPVTYNFVLILLWYNVRIDVT
jgi:hypothetical protein